MTTNGMDHEVNVAVNFIMILTVFAAWRVCMLIPETFDLVNRHLRFIIFTMEVAVAAMPPGVDQWILILDAGGKLLLTCALSLCYSDEFRANDA